MIIFAAQLDGFSISKIGDRVLKLRTYDQYAEEVSQITNSKMGSEYIIMMIPTTNKEELNNWTQETTEQVQERFRKHMNALITQCAEKTGEEPAVFRERLKEELKEKGLIRESTKELDTNGYAEVIVLLKEILWKK